MFKKCCCGVCYFLVCLAVIVSYAGEAYSKDGELNVESIIQNHITSIADPQTVKGITVRGIGGVALVDFIQGSKGNLQGQAILLLLRLVTA